MGYLGEEKITLLQPYSLSFLYSVKIIQKSNRKVETGRNYRKR